MSVQYDLPGSSQQQHHQPSMMDMVTEAIMEDRQGVTMKQIKNYCSIKFHLDYENGNDKVKLSKALRNGVSRGVFNKNNGLYTMGEPASLENAKQESQPKRRKKKDGTAKRRGPGGLTKPMILSPELAAVCGGNRMGRTDVMKNLWVYIKANDLQDPSNKRNIVCDAKLSKLFPDPIVNMFNMAKFISAHLTKPEDAGEGAQQQTSTTDDQQQQEEEEEEEQEAVKDESEDPESKQEPEEQQSMQQTSQEEEQQQETTEESMQQQHYQDFQ